MDPDRRRGARRIPPRPSQPTPLFAEACNLYVSLNAAVWSVTVAEASTSSIPIPLDTGILGLAFGVQGVGLLPDRLTVSNGIAGLVGHW